MGKYSCELAEELSGETPDDECGDVTTVGVWYGLFREEKAILKEDSQGFVDVDTFETEDELNEEWDTLQEETAEEEDEEDGDDVCDLCHSSNVNAERTTPCGKTIGIECGCDEANPEGTCGDENCEACNEKDEDDDS